MGWHRQTVRLALSDSSIGAFLGQEALPWVVRYDSRNIAHGSNCSMCGSQIFPVAETVLNKLWRAFVNCRCISHNRIQWYALARQGSSDDDAILPDMLCLELHRHSLKLIDVVGACMRICIYGNGSRVVKMLCVNSLLTQAAYVGDPQSHSFEYVSLPI